MVARDVTNRIKIEKELTEAKNLAESSTIIAHEEKNKAEDAVKSKQQFHIQYEPWDSDTPTADLEKCTEFGMNDYLAKPLDERLMYAKIMNLVKKTQ